MADGISSPRGMTKFDWRAPHNVAVLVSLTLVMLAAVAALVLVQGITRQIDDVVHTYDVRNEARELTTALAGAESAQRGFLLTGDESYLETYRYVSTQISSRLMSLTGLTKDDRRQAEQVRGIAAEIVDRLAEMESSVRLLQDERSEDARQLLATGIGERLMGSLQAALETFIDDENAKLIARNREINDSRRWLVISIIIALTGAVILAYVLVARTQKQVIELARSKDLLHSENELLEARVTERTQALEQARLHAEQERQRVEALLRDASHRIGNSLATVSSLLGLQLLRTQSEEVRVALEAARSRVHAIASAHRRLRLGHDLETTSANEFLDAVLEDIALTTGDAKSVAITGEFDHVLVGARDATTIGILAAELVTNALKHGYPEGRSGTIAVSFKFDTDGVPVLKVMDDGVGVPADQKLGEGGLGSVIVTQLANQFGGSPNYQRRATGGVCVSVPMPNIVTSNAAD